MTLRYVDIPLFEDDYYGYSITLEGNSYNLEFVYNNRMELYTLSLFTADGEALVRGQAVVPNFPLLKDYVIDELTGFFWMEPIAEIGDEFYKTYPKDLAKYYRMFYIYEDGE